MCMLPVLGPKYLRNQDKVITLHSLKSYAVTTAEEHAKRSKQWINKSTNPCWVECLHSYPSLYLKCLKAKFITSWMSPSKRGWSGIWIKREGFYYSLVGSSGVKLSAPEHANNVMYDLCTAVCRSQFISNIQLVQLWPHTPDISIKGNWHYRCLRPFCFKYIRA